MTVILLLHTLLVLTFTIRILLRDDLSPPGRLAWFIVLNLLPYFGSGIYFLFGETDIGNRASKRHKEVFQEIWAKASWFMGDVANTEKLIEPVYRPAFRYAGSINGFHPSTGNRAELMRDGDETLTRMVADIDSAADHVHVLYYIWLDDNTGHAIAEALIRAAHRGITCRAMADGLGSRALINSGLWQRMKEAGVHMAVALSLKHPIHTILTSRMDLRNHRKITVIDSRITYCGSRNSADPEFLVKAKYAPGWISCCGLPGRWWSRINCCLPAIGCRPPTNPWMASRYPRGGVREGSLRRLWALGQPSVTAPRHTFLPISLRAPKVSSRFLHLTLFPTLRFLRRCVPLPTGASELR
ncbi:phospholipase D-like domain-containing protein [Marinobacter sp. AC-23]|uniref:phospholipase D-like domain-containing protein n=1 Tax=Marinobacter sp. AC-23 TaxID=1879031 RepID=UPI000B316329|nr:phospholipase D-like domain-containing protein [Marinobacter sp. AC-23]